jgi:hypothetical protein
MENENNEIWKTIEGFGDYEVSNLGRVKSFKFGKERILKSRNRNGYLAVDLWKECKRTTKNIHQLVAIAFLNHKVCGMEKVVDHIDMNKTNNNLNNLQIVSFRENVSYKRGKSEYTGVYWHKDNEKWYSRITINKKSKYLGSFDDENKAHLAYQKALKALKALTN